MTTRDSKRTHTWRLFVAGAAMAAVLAPALVAKADEESDLVRAIEDDLGYIKGYLDGIAGDSSDGDLGYAIDYAGRVREKAEKLRSVGATSDNARTMAEKYPDWARSFVEAANALRALKGAQLRLRDDKLPDRCREATTSLKDEIRRVVEDNAAEGISTLGERAERTAEEPRRLFAQHEEMFKKGERWRDDARRFSESHGRWSDVRSELHDGAAETWEMVRRTWEETGRDCSDVIKGRENPIVKEAMQMLSTSDAGRKQLVESMTTGANEIATQLGKAATSTDDDAQIALSRLSKLRSDLAILEKSKGKSADAQKTYDLWKRAIDDLPASLEALGKVKAFHKRADKLPADCSNGVKDRGQALSKNHRGAGHDAIAFADELGKQLTERLGKATQARSEIEGYRNSIRFSASDDPWRNVATQLATAADALVKYYVDALGVATSTCEDVAKGAQAERFKDKLKGTCTKSEVQELDKLVDANCKQAERTCIEAKVAKKDCATLRSRLEVNKRCLAARVDLRDWCKEPNDTHAEQVVNETKAVETCERRIADEC